MNFRHGPKISYLTNNENYQHIRRIDSRSCAPSQGEVNGSTSWCPIGRISPIRPMPPNAKAPFSIFFAKYMRRLQHISIIISVRYNLTDRKNRPFGLRFLCRDSQYKIAHIGANPQNQRLLHIRSKRLRSISIKIPNFAV